MTDIDVITSITVCITKFNFMLGYYVSMTNITGYNVQIIYFVTKLQNVKMICKFIYEHEIEQFIFNFIPCSMYF